MWRRLGAVVADGLNRAALHGFLAAGLLFRSGGLLEDDGVATILVALEVVRGSLTAQVAVDALAVHVVLAGGVFWVFVCFVSHNSKFSLYTHETARTDKRQASFGPPFYRKASIAVDASFS